MNRMCVSVPAPSKTLFDASYSVAVRTNVVPVAPLAVSGSTSTENRGPCTDASAGDARGIAAAQTRAATDHAARTDRSAIRRRRRKGMRRTH